MSDALKQKEELLSSKDAGKLLGYTHDYISKLCREGKMSGIQKGRVWYVTKEEALAFRDRHEAELAQKKALLSQKFSEIRSQHESKRLQTPSLATVIEEKVEEKIESPLVIPKFVIPKQFVAASVLALILMAPSFLNSISTSSVPTKQSSATISNSSESFSINEAVQYFDAGVANVISAQSELYLQAATTFSFLQYLNDGYWELAKNAGKLSQGLISFLNTMSEGYLTFYLIQGYVVLNSLIQIESMGANVLSGYELMGQSIVVGSKNTISAYQEMLNIDSKVESSKKKLTNFTSDTTEGLAYAQAQIESTIVDSFFGEIKSSIFTVIGNINANLSYISYVLGQTSDLVVASVINTFSFDLLEKEGVRKVESNQ